MWIASRWGMRLFMPPQSAAGCSEAAVEALARRLQASDRSPDLPTVPMPGGWGTVWLQQRPLLGAAHLLAVRPALRAYVVLGLVGWRTADAGAADNVYARWFLRDSATWFDAYPTALGEFDLSELVAANKRWIWMLAALRLLAVDDAQRPLQGVQALYEAAVDRCRNSTLDIGTVPAPMPRVGAQHSDVPQQWDTLIQALRDAALRNRLLVRLLLHVLFARLNVAPPRTIGDARAFYAEILDWVDRVAQEPGGTCRGRCTVSSPGYPETARQLLFVMRGLQLFGGHAPLAMEGGSGLPRLFQPLDGGELPHLRGVLAMVDPELRPGLQSAWMLGELAASHHLDLFSAAARFQEGSRADAHEAFAYAARRMDTTRREYNQTHAMPLLQTRDRLAVRALLGELGRADHRTPRRVAELLRAAGSFGRFPSPVCHACRPAGAPSWEALA